MVSFEKQSLAPPPEHILHAFSVEDCPGKLLYRDLGAWIYSDIVLSPVFDPAIVSWSAQLRENLIVPGVRVAKPIRSKDGRHIVAGWHADTYIPGRSELRADEMIATSFRLHEALENNPRPRFLSRAIHQLRTEVDIFSFADQIAWDDDPANRLSRLVQQTPISLLSLQIQKDSFEMILSLISIRESIDYASQLVHGDLYASMLFSDDLAPGIVDFTVYFRPKEWAAALIAVDAITWGGEEKNLLKRWLDIPQWKQMLIRALIFRFVVYILHPYSQEKGFVALKQSHNHIYRFLRE